MKYLDASRIISGFLQKKDDIANEKVKRKSSGCLSTNGSLGKKVAIKMEKMRIRKIFAGPADKKAYSQLVSLLSSKSLSRKRTTKVKSIRKEIRRI